MIGPVVYDDAVGYRTRRYGSNQRWMTKALREVAHQIGNLVTDLGERELTERVEGDEWCIKEIVGYIRDLEREDLRSVQAILREDGARIEPTRADFGPLEHDYRGANPEDLLWDFFTMREELVWLLRTASDSDWERAGVHPYRGRITLDRLVHEINERDLAIMWRIQSLRDRLEVPPRRRRRG